MGRDIHIVLERRRQGSTKWIGEFTTSNHVAVGEGLRIASRDFNFFAWLTGSKTHPNSDVGHAPKGVPRDISDLAWDEYMEFPTAHISASHMSAEDFCAAWLAENPNNGTSEKTATYDLLGIDTDGECEYRVVFWFDD